MESNASGVYRHGSPRDRGQADAYYNRPAVPHYYEGDTYATTRYSAAEMSEYQIEQYMIGYSETFERKDWGA